MTEILAKSEPPITLQQHIEDGLSVWAHLQSCFPSAPVCAQNENFWRLLWLCVVMHDLGKAHSEFQKVLRGLDNDWHSQRHELFSLPFASRLELPENERRMVLRVVAGHHKTYSRLRTFIRDNYEQDPLEFDREFSKVDVDKAVELANEFEKDLIKGVPISVSPSKIINEYKREVRRVIKGREKEIADYFTLLLLMGAFHHCDHLSSAFVTEFGFLEDSTFAFLDRLKSRLYEKGLDFYHHQRAASQGRGNVILTAPTGSGKTETSMLWLRNQLKYKGQGRVFYILPFTASINAMFERLSHDEEGLGEQMVGMLHGKLDAYLYESFFEDAGNLTQLKADIKVLKQTFKNLQTPLKVLTPFQLLKHLFGLKGFEKGIFEWVGGHFIFDEIHAYDPEVTAQIIVLLEFLSSKLQARIFVMTATLPTFLKKRIGEAIGRFEEISADTALYESFKRHRLKLTSGLLSEHYHWIEKDLKQEKSVLVVCNTVDQAREVFETFKSEYEALLIHGRFTAKDRARIEQQLQNLPPQLLIGTQAIEVSLDIDYDIIYTEPAPLDALIQRFGRVNRKGVKDPCPCFVFRARNEKDKWIYDQKIVDNTLSVLEKIEVENEGVIREIQLQNYIDEVYPQYEQEAQESFDKVYFSLTQYVNRLTPFEPSPDGEEEYYRQFDGVKVLPAFYEKNYKQLLDEFDFIGAEQLKVSIRKNWFARLINTPDLEQLNHVIFPSDNPNVKAIDIKYYKINKRYRPGTGLDLETGEDADFTENIDDHIL